MSIETGPSQQPNIDIHALMQNSGVPLSNDSPASNESTATTTTTQNNNDDVNDIHSLMQNSGVLPPATEPQSKSDHATPPIKMAVVKPGEEAWGKLQDPDSDIYKKGNEALLHSTRKEALEGISSQLPSPTFMSGINDAVEGIGAFGSNLANKSADTFMAAAGGLAGSGPAGMGITGALAGASVGGPPGALIGGGIGILAGLATGKEMQANVDALRSQTTGKIDTALKERFQDNPVSSEVGSGTGILAGLAPYMVLGGSKIKGSSILSKTQSALNQYFTPSAVAGMSATTAQDSTAQTLGVGLESGLGGTALSVALPPVLNKVSQAGKAIWKFLTEPSGKEVVQEQMDAVSNMMNSFSPHDPNISIKIQAGAEEAYLKEQQNYRDSVGGIYAKANSTPITDQFRTGVMNNPNTNLAIQFAQSKIHNPEPGDLVSQQIAKMNPNQVGYWEETQKWLENKANQLRDPFNGGKDALNAGKYSAAAGDIRSHIDQVSPLSVQARALAGDAIEERNFISSTPVGRLIESNEGQLKNISSKLIDGSLPPETTAGIMNYFSPDLQRGIVRRAIEEKINPTTIAGNIDPLDFMSKVVGNQKDIDRFLGAVQHPDLADIKQKFQFLIAGQQDLNLQMKILDRTNPNSRIEWVKKTLGMDTTKAAGQRAMAAKITNFLSGGDNVEEFNSLLNNNQLSAQEKPEALFRLISKQSVIPPLIAKAQDIREQNQNNTNPNSRNP